MRLFGLLGLVVALAALALVVKHQFAAHRLAPQASPASAAASAQPAAAVRQQAQDLQRQYREALDDALRQPARAMPDEAK